MASLARYILRRAIQGALTLVVVTIIVWLLFYLQPGSILLQLKQNPQISKTVVQQIADQFGLNDPWYVQLWRYLVSMFTFQFGWSFTQNKFVVSVLQEALPRTVFLFGGAVLIEYVIGVFVGRYIAWKRGRGVEGGVIVTSLFFYNMPSFWIGLILLFTFAYLLNWFPLGRFMEPDWTSTHYPWLLNLQPYQFQTVLGVLVAVGGVALAFWAWYTRPRITSVPAGEVPPEIFSNSYRRVIPGGVVAAVGVVVAVWHVWTFTLFDVGDVLLHGFLPMMALVAISTAGTILLMQTSMLEVMGEDFILTARAKGLSERVVRRRHAARNAYLPVVTSLAISLGFIVGGAIILEFIFSYYGLGSYLLTAIYGHDPFLAGSILFIISVLVIFGNIIADILYGVLDPRVRI